LNQRGGLTFSMIFLSRSGDLEWCLLDFVCNSRRSAVTFNKCQSAACAVLDYFDYEFCRNALSSSGAKSRLRGILNNLKFNYIDLRQAD